MVSVLKRFAACESGATSIEYGLIALGIGLAIAAAAPGVGAVLSGVFTNVKNQL